VLAVTVAVVAAALVAVPSALAWTVDMTAQAKLKRTHAWKIEKSVDAQAVTLKAGETADLTYAVTVSSTGSTDSNWGVDGTITMSDDPLITIGTLGVEIVLTTVNEQNPIPATVTCVPSPFPVNLGTAGLVCQYSALLPDATTRIAYMRARTTAGNFRTATAPVDFATASVEQVDECVAASDSMTGALGNVCAGDAPRTFTYTKTIGPFTTAQCGTHTVDNTARYVAGDTGATGSSSVSTEVTVVCEPPPGPACTRTIGYWKTHAGFGPQADVVTPLLPVTLGTPGGAKSVTVTTAALAVQLLSMEGTNGVKSASNGINKLYAQLLGAKLNAKSSADTSSVAAVIAAADAFLATHDTLSWKSLSKAQQAQVNAWMSALDAYNNGLGSADHCG
jgi:hypothetical protein